MSLSSRCKTKQTRAPDLGRVPSFHLHAAPYLAPAGCGEITFGDEIHFVDEIRFADEIEESPSALTRWRLPCVEGRNEIYKKTRHPERSRSFGERKASQNRGAKRRRDLLWSFDSLSQGNFLFLLHFSPSYVIISSVFLAASPMAAFLHCSIKKYSNPKGASELKILVPGV